MSNKIKAVMFMATTIFISSVNAQEINGTYDGYGDVYTGYISGANKSPAEIRDERDFIIDKYFVNPVELKLLENTEQSPVATVLDLVAYNADAYDQLFSQTSEWIQAQGFPAAETAETLNQLVEFTLLLNELKGYLDNAVELRKFHATAWKNPERLAILHYLSTFDPGILELLGVTAASLATVAEQVPDPFTTVIESATFVTTRLLDSDSAQSQLDIDENVVVIDSAIGDNDAINIVSYGTGNLIVRESLERVTPYKLDKVGIVGISTTTKDYSGVTQSGYTNLAEDFVLAGSGALSTSTIFNLEGNEKLAVLNPISWIGANIAKYGALNPLGHDLETVYLKDGENSEVQISATFGSNRTELRNRVEYCPECFEGVELPFPGFVTGIWEPNDPSPDHYSGDGYSKNYTLEVSSTDGSGCREVQFDLGSEVDSYIDIRVNNTRIDYADDGGFAGNPRVVAEMNLGTYDIEVTGKVLYTVNPESNKFGLVVTDLGPCVTVTDNIYLTDAGVDYETSNIVLDAGQEVRLGVEQRYSGDTLDDDLPNPNLTYYFSKDTNFTSDEEIEYDSSSIGSDDVWDGEREYYIIPSGTEAGTWYFGFKADSANEILESDEDDNIAYVEVTVTGSSGGSEGDVFLEDVTVSESLMQVGEEYRLRARHSYEGDMTKSQLSTLRLRYYLSDDTTFSSDDDYIGYDTSTIGSDDSYDTESIYWTPSSSDRGSKFILFIADYYDRVDESDESNNIVWKAVAIY